MDFLEHVCGLTTLATTGLFSTADVQYGGLEFVHQMDSLLIQAEYTGAWNRTVVGNGVIAPASAELGARYNELCLVDSGLNGGRLQDITIGLNWFLNPNMKIQSNYTHTIRDTVFTPGGSSYDGFGMRLAWDF